jgi:hypothetical protein
MTTIAAARPAPGLARWGALGGILYVVLFIVGTILLYGDSPDSSSAPAKIVAYYSDSGNRDKISAGWVVGGLGVFFFLWFLGALRGAVRRWEGVDGYLTAMTTIGGVVYGTLALTALAINMGIRTMSDDTFQQTVYPEVLHAADDASYILHATGGAGASAMIIAASVAAHRAGVTRAWAMWLGIAAGIVALASVLFFTQAAIALWILVVSGLLFARGRAEPAGAV